MKWPMGRTVELFYCSPHGPFHMALSLSHFTCSVVRYTLAKWIVSKNVPLQNLQPVASGIHIQCPCGVIRLHPVYTSPNAYEFIHPGKYRWVEFGRTLISTLSAPHVCHIGILAVAVGAVAPPSRQFKASQVGMGRVGKPQFRDMCSLRSLAR